MAKSCLRTPTLDGGFAYNFLKEGLIIGLKCSIRALITAALGGVA